MLAFDAETAAFLEEVYQGSDFTRRRRASFDALDPRPGQKLVDLGCGNGMLALDLARAVGTAGEVIGIDPSDQMLDAARHRIGDRANVTLFPATAEAMPLDSNTIDGVVSVQVFEYLSDIAAELAEVARILKPGGRAVIADMHFGTLVWHSDQPGRMARILAAYEKHAACADLPQHLPAAMHKVGLRIETIQTVPFTDHQLRPDSLAAMMVRLVADYVTSAGLIDKDEADSWAAEQHELDAKGRFFFSLNHYVCVGRKA